MVPGKRYSPKIFIHMDLRAVLTGFNEIRVEFFSRISHGPGGENVLAEKAVVIGRGEAVSAIDGQVHSLHLFRELVNNGPAGQGQVRRPKNPMLSTQGCSLSQWMASMPSSRSLTLGSHTPSEPPVPREY